MTKLKTKKTLSPFFLFVSIFVLVSLPLGIWAVREKTNILGQASSQFQTKLSRPGVIIIKKEESFEKGFGGWEKGAWMPPGRAWSMERVSGNSKSGSPKPYDGQWEISTYQDGLSDDGTVWLTKSFRVDPNSIYEASLSFYLWSRERTDTNRWSVVAYGGLVKPEVKNSPDQWRFFEQIGETNEIAGWKQYSYRKTITTGPKNSTIWLAFGQHVLWETPRTYYWDLVKVQISPAASIY